MTHVMKLKIINVSPSPQRLHILPTETPFFKVKYNKRGMLASGVSEEIFVSFTPNENRYF